MMNAYQIPFNAGTSASPFNYFPPNSHSYSVISSSYGNPRTSNLNHAHKASMSAGSQSSFVTPSNYFHQSHPLQPFAAASFTNPVHQSSNGTNSYSHNHYGYNATGNSSPNMIGNAQNNFEYGHSSGYGSGTNTGAGSNGTTSNYPYSCSNNYGAGYPNSPNTSGNIQSINQTTNANNNSNSNNSLTYQSAVHNDYINLCNNNRTLMDGNDEMYTINLHKDDNHLPPIKKIKRSGRGGRSRRPINPSPSPENNIDRIFVWYIDETIFTYLTVSEYNRLAGFNDALTTSLYNDIFMFINKFADKYLFLSDLKDVDQSHIDDSAADDNGQDLSQYNFTNDGFKTSISCNMGSTLNSPDLRQKMALRYRKISETYSNYCDKLDELLDKSDYEQLQDLIKRFDMFSKNWIHPATKALSFIKTRPNCLNVLISSSPLIYTLSKLLVFNLGPYFSIGNVYSCSKTNKEHTLTRVLNRFGSGCTYIVVGKGPEEQQLSQKLELPFWPITEREHFDSLLNAMHYFF